MAAMSESQTDISVLDARAEARRRRRRWRTLKDIIARHSVAAGGIGVIVAIVLIFFYLLYVVLPLFESADIETVADYQLETTASSDGAGKGYLALEEQNEILTRFTRDGRVWFFKAADGSDIEQIELDLPASAGISSFSVDDPVSNIVAYGLDDGSMLMVGAKYLITYPDDKKTITPKVVYPMGEAPLAIDESGQALIKMAVRSNEESTTVVALNAEKQLLLGHFIKEESLLDDEPAFEKEVSVLAEGIEDIHYLLLDKLQANVFIIDNTGNLTWYDINDKQDPVLMQKTALVAAGKSISSVSFLAGEISLLVGDSAGRITQWFAVQNRLGEFEMQAVRWFDFSQSAITNIVSEQRRKGFIVADANGRLGVFHSTAERLVYSTELPGTLIKHIALSPRANALVLEEEGGKHHFWLIHNEHPEVSWSSLWGEVWYESYPGPEYKWQSSSASNDFEPKMSLTPLVFGTIKGALYAMMFAIPLAIMGAIYTAYFMAPGMRRMVKPSIETMEALPTVILGFLAGLWFAPYVEAHLPGIFSLLIFMPLGILGFALVWHVIPAKYKHWLPDGWYAALLIPVVLLIGWFALSLSQPMELWFFDGNMRVWLSETAGIDYDQRNALVVGFAMGFAVIPTIFSIAEDAIFSVPKHLSYGSLALGATPWQTLVRVVLLTASPGIFSAVMIGLGRAVGETMIVLMATGNTPVMDLSIFQGMRTLAANIAVEMPESEVDSTHYRILFLAALVLFMLTFLFNTVAELVRQRLREKYSSL